MEPTPWDEEPAVILDNGSGNIKCGFAGEEVPRSVFPAVIGTPKLKSNISSNNNNNNNNRDVLIGEAALQTSGLKYNYPMEHGIVSDWAGLQQVWAHAFHALQVPPGQQAVLLTEAPLNPTRNREKMAELLFEGFSVPALHIQIQAVLTLYAAGRTDGLVLDSGDGVTHVVPVFEGQTIPRAVRRLELAGRDLTEWMMQLLSDELNRPLSTTADREIARRVKESLCYVSEEFEVELAATEELQEEENNNDNNNNTGESFILPDGSTIHVGRARFCCPEFIFNPALAELPHDGIHRAIVDCVQSCPIDLRRRLLNSIVLSGGNTMFRGFPQRLQREVTGLVNARAAEDVHVVAANERKFSVWIGAAILASLTSFAAEWVTRQEYEEQGPTVLHRRCDSLTFVSK